MLHLSSLSAISLVLWLPLTAAALTPDADTFVRQKTLGEVAEGTRDQLVVKSDNPAGGNDRAAVLRFTLPGNAEVGNATLRLVRKPGKPEHQPDPMPTLQLFGVADAAEELSFDEGSWAAGGNGSALDHSGNRVRESHTFDADDAAPGAQPLATATPGDGEVSFSSEALDGYLRDRMGGSVGFLLIAERGEENGNVKPVVFHSREAGGAEGLKPTLSLEGEPAAVPSGAAASASDAGDKLPNGAVAGTHIHFEPGRGAELTINAVTSPTIRYSFYDQDGRRYNLPAQGGTADPKLSDEQAREGEHSLKLHCGATEGDDRDRVEFRLKTGSTDDEPFRFGQERWYGWSLFIDPSSETPDPGRWLHVGQLWQPSTVGRAAKRVEWGIPGALSFLPSASDWALDVVLKSDGQREQFSFGTLEPGQWHDIVLNVKLSHSHDDTDGHYRAWVNGEPVVNEIVGIGNFPRVDGDFEAKDAMDIRMGMYRKNQPKTQTFYLDEIWFDEKPKDPAMAELPVGGGVDGKSQLKDAVAASDTPAEPR